MNAPGSYSAENLDPLTSQEPQDADRSTGSSLVQDFRSEGGNSKSITQIRAQKMNEARKLKSSISRSFSDDSSVADVETVALVSNFIDSLQNDNSHEQGSVLNEAPSWQTTKSSSSSTTMRYKETLAKARNAVATVSMKKKSIKEVPRSVELIISSTESSDGDVPPPPPPPLTENQEQNHVNMTHSTKSNDVVIPPPSIVATENREMVHNDTNSIPLATQDGKIEPVGDLESLEHATQFPTHIAQHVSPAIAIALNSYAKIKKNVQSYQVDALLENGIDDASKEPLGGHEKHRPCPNLSPTSVLAKARAASAARAARVKSKKTESCDENESSEVKYDKLTDMNSFGNDSSSNLGQSEIDMQPQLNGVGHASSQDTSNTREATSACTTSEQPKDCATASKPIAVVTVGGKVMKSYVPFRPGQTPRSKATLEYAKSIISASKRGAMPRRDNTDWRKKVNLPLLDEPQSLVDIVLDDTTPQPMDASTVSTTITLKDDSSNPKSKVKSSDSDTHIRIGSHIIPKDVNFYAVLSQIQKAVSSDNVSDSLGRILVDSNRRGISMEVMTELYKIEMLKVGNPREESSSNSSIPSTGLLQEKLLEPPQEADIVIESSLSNLTIANEDDDDHENTVTTIQGDENTTTTKSSDNAADDMQELLHLCDRVKSLFNESNDNIDVKVECSTPKMKNASFSGGPFSFEDESVCSTVTNEDRDDQTPQDLNEDKNDSNTSNSSQSGYEISLPGLTEDQLNQLNHFVSNTEMLRETSLAPQLCIDYAVKQSFEVGIDSKYICEDMSEQNDNVEEIDAFLSRFHIDGDAHPNKYKEASQNQDKRVEVMHDEYDNNEINAEKTPMKGKRKAVSFKALSPTSPRRKPLMEISSPLKIDRAKPMDTLCRSPKVHQEVCTLQQAPAPTAIYFKRETRRQCFLPKKTRLAGHSGYMNIDFYSLYDATLVKAQDEIIDRAPWEYRDVGQRFLDEKSLESRNWFGESMINNLCHHFYLSHSNSLHFPHSIRDL